jgi:hypothetical protein
VSEQRPGPEPTEEEMRAAYAAQLREVRVDDVLVQTTLSLVNLGALRAGLSGSDADADADELRSAIEGIRALLPVVEPLLGPDAGQIRQALSQLQIAYTRLAGDAATAGAGTAAAAGDEPAAPAGESPADPSEAATEDPEGPGPAQRSGRLWVPGT